MKNIGILGSIAYDNIFIADHVPVIGERVFGKKMGKYIGGMAANQAIEAARYTKSVRLIGCVGSDTEGNEIINQLKSCGIDTNLIQRDLEDATGQAFMFLIGDDYFSIVTQGANNKISIENVIQAIDEFADGILMVSLEVNQNVVYESLKYAKQKQIDTFLVCSPAEKCSKDMIEIADSIILNKREFNHIFKANVMTLHDTEKALVEFLGKKKRMLITLGSQGAVLMDDGQIFSSKALKVKAVDAIGAGDALAGAYIGSLSNDFAPQKALSIGCIAGALAVTKVGPQTSSHTMQEVLDIYQNNYQ